MSQEELDAEVQRMIGYWREWHDQVPDASDVVSVCGVSMDEAEQSLARVLPTESV